MKKNNENVKKYIKAIGIECIFMAVVILVACFAAFVQFLGRTKIGTVTGFFSGKIYQYNVFSYSGGIILFLLFFLFVYKKYMGKSTTLIVSYRIVWRVIYWVISAVLSVAMFFVLFLFHLMQLGLVDNMDPELLILVTVFGWPVFSATFQGVDLIIKSRRQL